MNAKFLTIGLAIFAASSQITQAQETPRPLASDRGRYVGAILNSEWFSNNVIVNYENVHKREFNPSSRSWEQ